MPKPVGLQFTARLGSLAADTFAVVDFQLTEGLSRLFQLTLNLASVFPDLTAADVLDQDAELAIHQDGELLRQVHGVVSSFSRADTGHRRTRYQVIVQPALWRLGLMHNSRIFQHRTSQDILQTLLEERGIATTRFDLLREPREREYCVQHRESDYDFLTRLAAEEGWHYRFDQAGGQHTLVLSDHHREASRLDEATYNASAGGSHRQPCVFRFQYREQVSVSAVAMKDYTFKNPAYALMHEQAAETPHQRDDYQHYDYPGRFKADASGQAFTRARLDALRADSSQASGQSNRPDLTPGAKLLLTGHSHTPHNRDWLITAVTHTGQQPQALEEEGGSGATTYHNDFSAIPADRPWRPTVPRRPIMDGPQIALVTGPDGEEIHCDEYGRVKVRFLWDRRLRPEVESANNDEHSSAWLRVSQGWAGGQYGFMAIPRIGHEVIVSFLDGDPDQPIITGRTYHAGNMPPYSLPQHKTRTTLKTRTHKGEGSNELRFEDEAGQEQVYAHAQKDLDLLTENDRTEVIRRDSHLTVGNHRKVHIKGDDHCTVAGEQRQRIGGDRSLTTGGSHHCRQGQSQLVEAGREIHHKAGLKIVIEAGAEVTLKAGGSFVKVDASGVTVSGPMVKMNSGGAPGSGAAQQAQSPHLPGSLDAHIPEKVVSPALAISPQRKTFEAIPSSPEKLRRMAQKDLLFGAQCHRQADGSCPLTQCPCDMG